MTRWTMIVGVVTILLLGTGAADEVAAKGDKKQPTAAKKTAPKGETLESLCDLGAERTQDLRQIDQEKMSECGSSPMSPGVPQCYQEYESQKLRVVQRYDARMARFREKAEKQLGRKLKGTDCCDALPGRFRMFGSNCVPYR